MILRRRLCVLVVGLCLVFPHIAAATTQAELRARLETLKRESQRAGDAYSKAHWALDETDVAIARTGRDLRKTAKLLSKARRRLNSRARSIYRRESLDLFGLLVGAASFSDFATRMEFLSRVGKSDAAAVSRVELLQSRLRSQQSKLRHERRDRASRARDFLRRRDRLQKRLIARQAEFRALKRRLDVVRSGGAIPRGVASVPGPNGMVFPVSGSYYYADTWGASRSGGRRRHQGTDIMAPRGTPVLAIMSGTVHSKTGGLGGRTIWLTASNGWQFYYAHLDRWVVTSGHVRAGQVIATVGSTGNASGGAPHLHFQVHPGGGSPVNPYPYLRGME